MITKQIFPGTDVGIATPLAPDRSRARLCQLARHPLQAAPLTRGKQLSEINNRLAYMYMMISLMRTLSFPCPGPCVSRRLRVQAFQEGSKPAAPATPAPAKQEVNHIQMVMDEIGKKILCYHLKRRPHASCFCTLQHCAPQLWLAHRSHCDPASCTLQPPNAEWLSLRWLQPCACPLART